MTTRNTPSATPSSLSHMLEQAIESVINLLTGMAKTTCVLLFRPTHAVSVLRGREKGENDGYLSSSVYLTLAYFAFALTETVFHMVSPASDNGFMRVYKYLPAALEIPNLAGVLVWSLPGLLYLWLVSTGLAKLLVRPQAGFRREFIAVSFYSVGMPAVVYSVVVWTTAVLTVLGPSNHLLLPGDGQQWLSSLLGTFTYLGLYYIAALCSLKFAVTWGLSEDWRNAWRFPSAWKSRTSSRNIYVCLVVMLLLAVGVTFHNASAPLLLPNIQGHIERNNSMVALEIDGIAWLISPSHPSASALTPSAEQNTKASDDLRATELVITGWISNPKDETVVLGALPALIVLTFEDGAQFRCFDGPYPFSTGEVPQHRFLPPKSVEQVEFRVGLNALAERLFESNTSKSLRDYLQDGAECKVTIQMVMRTSARYLERGFEFTYLTQSRDKLRLSNRRLSGRDLLRVAEKMFDSASKSAVPENEESSRDANNVAPNREE